MDDLVVIHIGKCGGSTVLSELISNNIEHTNIHIQEAIYQPNKKYVIVLRNPVKRFISAFNWRYHLVCDSKIQQHRFENEHHILNNYQNIDNLCNDLKNNYNIFNGTPSSKNYVHHLKEDIFFTCKISSKNVQKNKYLE